MHEWPPSLAAIDTLSRATTAATGPYGAFASAPTAVVGSGLTYLRATTSSTH